MCFVDHRTSLDPTGQNTARVPALCSFNFRLQGESREERLSGCWKMEDGGW